MVWNRSIEKIYIILAYIDKQFYDYQINGTQYSKLNNMINEIKKQFQDLGWTNVDLLDINYFLWDLLEHYNNSYQPDIENNQTLHDELQEKLITIGNWLGYHTRKEVKIAVGAVVDVIWEYYDDLIGTVTYVFEIQTKGNVDSLIMNLWKATSYLNVRSVVAISDKEQLNVIKNESEKVFKNSNFDISLWNYKEVFDVFDKLQFVKESVNSIIYKDNF